MRPSRDGRVGHGLLVTLAAACALALLAACASGGDSIPTSAGPVAPPAATVAAPALDADGVPATMERTADVDAAATQWNRSEIPDYSYRARVGIFDVSGESPGEGCGAAGGLFDVTVRGGEAVAASVVDAACAIDLSSPDRPPLTAEEWYDELAFIMTDHDVAELIVNDVGFPTIMFTESRLGAIELQVESFTVGNQAPDSGAVVADLAQARAVWEAANIDSYVLTLDRVCRCVPGYRGRFTVAVGDATGSDVTLTVDDAAAPADLDPNSFTVDGLFDTIEALADADRLNVLYDRDTGIPLRIDADPKAGTADDEWTITAIGWQPQGTEANPDLSAELSRLGAAVDSAPSGATTLGQAHFCGVDLVDTNAEDIGGNAIARACLLAHQGRPLEAVLLQQTSTTEGDPIFEVTRVNADGSVSRFTDSSRDEFGSGGWSERTCAGLRTRPEIGVNFFTLNC